MGKHVVTVEATGGTDAIHDEAKKFVGRLKGKGHVVHKAFVQHDSDAGATHVDVSAAPAVVETPAPSADVPDTTGGAAS